MKDLEFSSMLLQLSDAISKKGEKYVDLLRVLYRDLANVKSDLGKAKCAFDLFQVLIAPGILNPTDISVLFETIELTGLKYLKEIVKRYETYPDEVKITRFSPHRQQVVALGKDFSVKDLQKVSQLYEGSFCSPWKLIQHLEDTSVLTEKSISSFLQRLNEKVNEDFNQLLVTISDAIGMKGEKYVDMLRVLYKDLAEIKTELEEAESAFDLFQILRVADILKATDISVLFETIELTGLRYLRDIINPYNIYPDEVKITRFSAHRQQVFALGKDFSTIDIQMICRKYEVPESFCSNPWKLIIFLECKGIVSKENLPSFLKNLKTVSIGEASVSKRPKLDKGIVEALVSKRPKLDNDKSGQSEQPQRCRADEDIIIKDSLMARQKELYRNENRMTPSIWHKGHKVDIARVFTELKLLQSKKEDKKREDKSTCTKKEGRPTSLAEALDVIRSTDSCKVLITGKGGMGKTTLLKYIAHQWATDDAHVFADKLLFLMNIREIKACTKTFLDILLNKIDCKSVILKNNLSWNSVERFLVTHDDEILILLDGYDELERNAKDPIDLFKREELEESLVMITSRPDNTSDLAECCDIHIEVKGFSPSNIKIYIKNHFHSIGKIKIGDSLTNEFKLNSKDAWYWGGMHQEAFELCSSPLLLLQICTIWELKRVLPTYLPDLFKEIVSCILNQYLNRAGNNNAISSFERIPDKYLSAFLILGECMYEGLKKNMLSIDKYDLSKNTNNEDLLNLALECGFVYEDTPVNPGDVREMYTPPHKLMSEALAGLYLSIEIQKGSSKVEYEEIRCNDYLNMAREFAIGFLGADTDKLMKPWLIIRASNYRSIVQCLKHVKKEHEDNILQKLVKHMSNDMKAYNKQMLESYKSLANQPYSGKRERYSLRSYLEPILRCSERMLESFRSFQTDDLSCIHLFKFLGMCYSTTDLDKEDIDFINRCKERRCQIVAHILVLFEVLKEEVLEEEDNEPHHLLQYISTWEEEINLLSAEMERHQLKYYFTEIEIDFKISSTFLIHFLKYATELEHLSFYKDSLITGNILNEVINDLYNANRKLELIELNISDIDLNDIDGMFLGKLFKIAPKLKYLDVSRCRLSGGIFRAMITASVGENITLSWEMIGLSGIYLSSMSGITLAHLFMVSPKLKLIDMSDCSLSGRIFNEMIEECCRMNVVLKDCRLKLKDNNLSDINGKSLVELVRIMFKKHYHKPHYNFCDEDTFFSWKDHSLTVDNLEELVESVGENVTFNWERLDLSEINLSSISGITLAHLFKVSPELNHIYMSNCSLSGRIVNEMMEECCRMNVVLKDNMFFLKGNDLSDIDGKSLAELIRVMHKYHCGPYYGWYEGTIFSWSDYSLTVNNLEMLVESINENITLKCDRIDLSNINLSSINGITLAHLLKISPELNHIYMSNCSLSGRIVNEIMEEFCRMKVVLKDNMLSLKGNDISDIDCKSLAVLVRVMHKKIHNELYILRKHEGISSSNYTLSVDNLEKLVETAVDLSGINLSSISGITLAHLFKVTTGLWHIDMSHCSLSGRIVNEMMEECCRMNVLLKDNMLRLKGNDLSDINGKSLAELVLCVSYVDMLRRYSIYCKSEEYTFRWSDYSLTTGNLENLVESVGENITFKWKMIDLNEIDLSSITGKTLAHLFKVSPELKHINMSNCSLSGRIVNEMMEECCRMNVLLKDNMLFLDGNDLSDINGKSLAESVLCVSYVDVLRRYSMYCTSEEYTFRWSDYSLTAGNLENLVESVGENITFKWKMIDLNKIDLSSISGKTLAHLFKVSPELKHINMSNCSLSGRIVNEMMEECCRMYVVLKDNMLSLKGNDLSDIDGISLAELVRVINKPYDNGVRLSYFHLSRDYRIFRWSDYSLTADNLKKLVESSENTTLNWEKLDFSKIDLSSISGKTLAHLFKVSPELKHINMSNCSLSGRIVNEMMDECCRMYVVLKDNMLSLKGNDLSDIDMHHLRS